MINSKLPVVHEDKHSYYDENDDVKYKNFLSPLPKNRYGSSSGKQRTRKTTIGTSNFYSTSDSPIGDRFIPKRRGQESNIAMYEINHEDSPPCEIDRDNFDNSWEYEECKAEYSQKLQYDGVLKECFFGTQNCPENCEDGYVEANLFVSPQKTAEEEEPRIYKKKLLNFKRTKSNKENQQRLVRNNTLRMDDFKVGNYTAKQVEKVTKIYPERVLDAPKMVDDFYLNLLDWSPQNVLAIALENYVYLMDVTSKKISCIEPRTPRILITSLSWMTMSKDTLAIGLDNGDVEIWDTNQKRLIRVLGGHVQRVSSLSWNQNILSTGSLDSSIINHDVRDKNHIVSRFEEHTKEVCGLKWSFDGQQLASGSNDNSLCIWDINLAGRPRNCYTSHKAAVKALAWCPLEPNLLASGGGTKDKSIKFWDTNSSTEMCSLKTSAQICSLMWSKNSKELVSSHGYEKNELFVWKYLPHKQDIPIVKTAELSGHESRVLHLAISPNGTTIASTAPDETLRFWKVFQSDEDSSIYTPFQGGSSLFRDVIR